MRGSKEYGGGQFIDPMALERIPKRHEDSQDRGSLAWPAEAVDLIVPGPFRDKDEFGSLLPRSPQRNELQFLVYNKHRPARKDSKHNFYFGIETIDQEILRQLAGKGDPEFFVHLGKLNGRPESMVLHSIDLHQANRGRGIGSEFLQRLFVVAKHLGFSQIVCVAENEPAKNLYRSLGFRPATGEILANMKTQGIYTLSKEKKETPLVKSL